MPHQFLPQAGSYTEYYGFREAPFSLTPDPKFAYSSTSHERALQIILHALSRREGLIVVTGDIGCGKTTLCRRLLPLLPERTFLSLVLNPFLTADDLLKQVLQDYGLMSTEELRRGLLGRTSCHDLARTLQDFLNSLSQINGTAVLIVDEAQNLPIRTLEQIRLLSNFDTDTTKLLQIILVGQRNLEPILQLEALRQLNQRVSRRCRIEPMSASEVFAYVEHRLSTAMSGSDTPGVRFQSDALSVISRLSNGVPRIINLLCDRALEMGHASQLTSIDSRLVLAAARDLELPIPATVRISAAVSRPVVRAAVTAGLIATVGSAVIANRGGFPAWKSSLRLTTQPPAAQRRDAASAASTTPLEPRRKTESESPAPLATVVKAAPSFELTVASFETAGRAKAVAGDLMARGYPARVAASDSWQIVRVGPYASLTEARQVKDALELSGFTDIRIAEVQ